MNHRIAFLWTIAISGLLLGAYVTARLSTIGDVGREIRSASERELSAIQREGALVAQRIRENTEKEAATISEEVARRHIENFEKSLLVITGKIEKGKEEYPDDREELPIKPVNGKVWRVERCASHQPRKSRNK